MRWALTTLASWAMPKRSRTATAACIVDQSLADPMTTPTSGASAIGQSPFARWRTGRMRSTTRSLWIVAP